MYTTDHYTYSQNNILRTTGYLKSDKTSLNQDLITNSKAGTLDAFLYGYTTKIKENHMNRTIVTAALLALFVALPAQASDIYAEYVRNYDGDTVTVDLIDLRDIDLDGTYKPLWDNIGIRVAGVDTPEMRGKCSAEKNLARVAKQFVKDALIDAEFIAIRNAKRGKYFRIVGDIIINPGTPEEVNLKDLLLDAELAVPYNGGRKTKSWCN